MSELTLATIIFVATYAVIISERLDRSVVALAGAGLMMAVGVLDQQQALEAIDANTIALLVGMMIIVNVLKQTGVFRYAAGKRQSRSMAIPGECLSGLPCSLPLPRPSSIMSPPSS